MLKTLAANFRRVIALIGPVVRNPRSDAIGAAVVMLAVLGWELAKALISHSENLVFWPMVAAFLIVISAIFFGVGAVVWLVVVLTVSLVRGQLRDEVKPRRAWPGIVLALGGLVLLGVPELCEKLAWWQENVFSRIPNEPVVLEECRTYLSDPNTILGLIFIAGVGCVSFLYVRRTFPQKLHRAGAIFKGLITGRDWRALATIAAATVLTAAALAVYHPSAWFFAIVFFEVTALLIWLFLPLIRQYWFQILLPIAWLVPVFIVNERIRGRTFPSFWLPLLLLMWGGWLFSPMILRAWPWRIVFWAGTLAFAGYIVYGPGSV
jgi:hypothetical protein